MTIARKAVRDRSAKTPLARRASAVLGAAAFSLLVLLLVGVPASADIIDFDPNTNAVPEILPADEIGVITNAMSAGFVYMLTPVSPGGRYVMAYTPQGMGFLDLSTGAFVPDTPSDAPGQAIIQPRWLDGDTLLYVNVESVDQGEELPPLDRYYWVEREAVDGSTSYREFDASALTGMIVDLSPALDTFLVVEVPSEAPDARVVQIGPTFDRRPRDDVPDNLPGLVGERAAGTVVLQQAAFELVLVDVDGSNRRPLTSLPEDSGLRSLEWSADGSRVALVTITMPDWESARSRGDDPPIPGTPNLSSINVREALGLLPPEENPLLSGTNLAVFSVESGAAIASVGGSQFPQGAIAGITFSPAGSTALLQIATRSELEGRQYPTYAYPAGIELLLLDDSMAVTGRLEAPPGLVIAGSALLDEERAVIVYADEVDSQIEVRSLESGLGPHWREPGAIMQLMPAGEGLVFSHADVDQPWELWSATLPSGDEQDIEAGAITDFSADASQLASALVAEPVSWATKDGETIYGVIVHHEDAAYPPEEPGPLVVWQQGGPGGQMVRDYGASVEQPYSILPHFGVPVLIANAAGRTVKDDAFYSSMADGDNFGQLDIAQIRDGIDALARRGIVHPGRVGVTGCSYGGYFTLQSLRAYPELFAAGNPQCTLADLTEEFTFGFTPVVAYLMGRSPMADPAEYLRDSPYYGAGDVSAKVLIFHGTDDFLPVQLLTNVHDELDYNEVPVTFLRVKGEGHGFSRMESQTYAAQLQVDFFRRYLVEADVGPPPTYGGTIYLPATFDRAAP